MSLINLKNLNYTFNVATEHPVIYINNYMNHIIKLLIIT